MCAHYGVLLYDTEFRRTVWGLFIADIYMKIFEDNVPNNLDKYIFQFFSEIESSKLLCIGVKLFTIATLGRLILKFIS